MAAAEHEYVVYQRGEEGESDAWDDTVLIKAYDSAVSAMKARLAEQHPEYSTCQQNSKTKKKKRGKSKQKKKTSLHESSSKWSVGDLCRAMYSEDGEIYEAHILSVDEDKGTCTVQYIGYGNEEDHLLSSLLSLESTVSSLDRKTDTASEAESLSRASVTEESHNGKHRSRKPPPTHHQPTANKQNAPRWPWSNYQMPSTVHMTPSSYFQPPPVLRYQATGPGASIPHTFPGVPPPPPLFAERGSGEENEALYSMLISWYMSGYHTGYYQGLKQSAANASAASHQGAYR